MHRCRKQQTAPPIEEFTVMLQTILDLSENLFYYYLHSFKGIIAAEWRIDNNNNLSERKKERKKERVIIKINGGIN